MKTFIYKQYLIDQKININQMEDYLNDELDKMEKYFDYSFNDILSYIGNRKKFKISLKTKNNKVDLALENLDNQIKIIQKNIKNPDFIIKNSKLEESVNKIEESFSELFDDNLKDQMIGLVEQYHQINVKNNISIKISNAISHNSLLQIIIKFFLFLLSFFTSYWISWKLDYLDLKLGKFWAAFFISCILYLSLDQLLAYSEKEFQFWRVKKLHLSYIKLIPIINKAKEILKNN